MRAAFNLIVLLSFSTIQAQTNLVVKKLNRKPFGGDLYGIHFVDSRFGHAVGMNGAILKTFDGGLHWVETYYPENTNFGDVFFPDHFHGYIVGDEGVVLKTIDGGASWIKLTFPINEILRKCYFFDPLEGIIIGNNGVILKTTDGGQSWFAPAFAPSGDYYTDIDFKGDYGIITTHGGLCLKTYDRGNSWITFTTPGIHEYSYAAEILGVDTFLISWYAPDNQINITYDGGNSYTEYAPGTQTSYAHEIEMDNNGNVYYANQSIWMARIHKDRSSVSYSNTFMQGIHDFQLLNSNKFVAVGSYGQLFIGDSTIYLESRDEGNKGIQAFRQFLNDSVLYGMTHNSQIIRSGDGGESFVDTIPSPSQNDVEFFYIQNDSTYLVFSRFVLYKTTNSGLSYDSLHSYSGRRIYQVIGKDSLISYTTAGVLEISFDGGMTWEDRSPVPATNLSGFAYSNRSIFNIQSGSTTPTFYRSDDLGINWFTHTFTNYPGSIYNLRVFFADSLNGFISFSDTLAIASPKLHYTTIDGGYSWVLDQNFSIETFLSNVSPSSSGDSIIFINRIYSTLLNRDYKLYHWQGFNNGLNIWKELRTYSRTLWDVERKPNRNIHVAGFRGAYYEFTTSIPQPNSIWPTSDTGNAEVLLTGQDLDLIKSARIGNQFINITYLINDTLRMRIPAGLSGDVYVMTEKDTINVGYFSSITLDVSDEDGFQNQVYVYPNPSKAIFIISSRDIISAEVFDAFGVRLDNSIITDAVTHWNVNLSGFKSGIYFIRIRKSNGEYLSKKLIKD
jgi:photosystem II stability/assembly factor-like uncharacterized protein